MQTMCLCWSPNPNNIIHLFISAQSRRPAGLTCHGYLNGEWNDELSPRQWRPLHREARGLDLLIALSAGSPQQSPRLLDQLRQRKTQLCPHRPGQARHVPRMLGWGSRLLLRGPLERRRMINQSLSLDCSQPQQSRWQISAIKTV